MQQTSLDMVRQSGFDWWLLVCVVASIVLASYLFVNELWRDPKRRVSMVFCLAGIGGTLLILLVPPLHNAKLGIVWTFLLLSMLSATFYLNLRGQLSAGRTALLLGMRIVALAMIVPMLFEPVWRYVTIPPPDRPLVFLIDTSGSMSVPDVQNGPTRLQSVYQALHPEIDNIRTHFVPQYFTFDSTTRDLKSPDDLAKMQADGKSTDIVQAVATGLAKINRDDASIVLITDGADNTSPNVADALRAAAHPVHTIRVGSERTDLSTVSDVSVDAVIAPDNFLVNHDNKLTAIIKSTAMNNRIVDIQSVEVDQNDKPIGEPKSRKLVLQSLPQGQSVDLTFRPTTPGLHRFKVSVEGVHDARNPAGKQQIIQGIALDPRIKVLYVCGSINLERKELRLAFLADSNIEFASYLRKDQGDVELEGTVDGEPFKALPTTAAAWKQFDVVILHDLDSSYFGPAQEKLIEQFVSNGGGLIMLGGHSSYATGGYGGTPIETALPVAVGTRPNPADFNRFVPRETADGATQPILEGMADWFGVDAKLPTKELPPVNGNLIVGAPKTGATVLLIHPGTAETVLAVQRYGKGRTAAFTVDTTYLWRLHLRDLGQDSPFNRFWGQLVRWLAGQDVRNRRGGPGVEALLYKSNYKLGEVVKLSALVRDEKGDATHAPSVSVTAVVTGPDGKPKTYNLQIDESQPGLYETTIPDPGIGLSKVVVTATKDAKELGKAPLSFTVLPPSDEMLKLAANPQLLAQIADETHGYHYELGQFNQFLNQLIRADPTAGVPQEVSVPGDDYLRLAAIMFGGGKWQSKYDLPIQGFALVGLLIAEWLLRRKWQLP
jgi:uncharacterized membrane protein